MVVGCSNDFSRSIVTERLKSLLQPTTKGEITLAESQAHVHGLAHHFNTMAQQKEAGMVGMWLFLLTEIMFFGGLFLAYTIYRTTYPQGFLYGSNLLNVPLGGTNKVVLIVR